MNESRINLTFNIFAERHYIDQIGIVRDLNLSGFLVSLYTSFKMVNWVSDYIDSIQKDIEYSISKPYESMLCPTADNIVKAMLLN